MEIIGIDAGATWIKAARLSDQLEILEETKVCSGASVGVEEYFNSINDVFKQLSKQEEDVVIGLALPAVLSKDRTKIKYLANIKGFVVGKDIDVSSALLKRFGTSKFVINNDADCAALAEWKLGHGKGNKKTRLLHLTWGTGVGTGLVVRGRSQYGWEGGHMPITWTNLGDIKCSCGSNIDVESLVAVPNMVIRAQRMFNEGALSTALKASDFDDLKETSKIINDLAVKGDELSQRVVSEALVWMARGLHTMAVVATPDVVTIGGAAMSNDWLLTELRKCVASEANGYTRLSLPSEIVKRGKLGNQAGVIGAAILAQNKVI